MANAAPSNLGSSGSNAEKEELRMILVGSPGSGKSTTGNIILGAKQFVSMPSPTPVTTECDRKECDRNGRHLVVVDTPGFFNIKTPVGKVQSDLKQCFDLCRPGPHAILLVMQAGHFTKVEKESIERIQRLFGKDALKYMIIVFSQKEDTENKPIDEFINEAEPKLKEIIKKSGNRYCAFNNKAMGDENTKQVSELIKIIEAMTEQNGSCYNLGQQQDPVEIDQRRILLVGKTGVGKSATGNTILGRRRFEAKALGSSVTTDRAKGACELNGKSINVIDTPGFFNTKLSNEETLKEIEEAVGLATPGAHAILLVIQVGRFTEQEGNVIKIMKYLFGVEALKYMIVVITQKDHLDDLSLEDFINHSGEHLQKLINRCGGRYCGFNNNAEGKELEAQRGHLLAMVEKVVEENKGGCYTNEMYLEASKSIRKEEMNRRGGDSKKREKHKILHEYKEAIVKTDKAKNEALIEEMEKNKKSMESIIKLYDNHLKEVHKTAEKEIHLAEALEGREMISAVVSPEAGGTGDKCSLQ